MGEDVSSGLLFAAGQPLVLTRIFYNDNLTEGIQFYLEYIKHNPGPLTAWFLIISNEADLKDLLNVEQVFVLKKKKNLTL